MPRLKRRVALAAAAASMVICGACGKSDGPLAKPSGSAGETTTTGTRTTPSTTALSPTTSGKAPTTTKGLPDPCTIVSKDDAEALAGTPLQQGVTAGTRDNMTCTYTGPTSGPLAQVEFFIGDGAKKYLDIDKQLGHEFEVITGVADEAHLEDYNVFFRKGNEWMGLRLTRLDDFAVYRDPLVDLARTVAARR